MNTEYNDMVNINKRITPKQKYNNKLTSLVGNSRSYTDRPIQAMQHNYNYEHLNSASSPMTEV